MTTPGTNQKIVIFSAPSGAGKTTIVQHLLKKKLPLGFSISATSRPPRKGESDGHDYYFLSDETFDRKVEEDAFIEWEEVYQGIRYGTLKSEIERIWNLGQAALFDVDVVGGLNLKKIFGKKAIAIFVQPPSIDALEKRLLARSTESHEKIAMRVSKAAYELTFASKFDHIIVNEHLENACKEAENLLAEFLNL